VPLLLCGAVSYIAILSHALWRTVVHCPVAPDPLVCASFEVRCGVMQRDVVLQCLAALDPLVCACVAQCVAVNYTG